MNSEIEVSVIGSGPAGLTAAIYSARAGLRTTVFAGPAPLGQLMYTTHVENFPGFEQITGPQLMENMKNQAIKLGVEFLDKKVDFLGLGNDKFLLRVGVVEYKSKTCILATGSEAKWLGLESENRFRGAGVSTCATCDGFFYKGKVVAVVGGGNTAVEDALVLSKIASKVILIHRRDTLRAEKIMQDRLFEQEKVEFLWNSEVQEFYGQDDVLTSILVKNNQTGELSNVAVDGVFIAIGHTPQTDLVKGLLALDELGYVKTGPITNVSGLFVAGDVHDSIYRQAITAAGDGCKAALEASKLIASEEKSCVVTPVLEVYKQSDYRSLFKVEPTPKRKRQSTSRSDDRGEIDKSKEGKGEGRTLRSKSSRFGGRPDRAKTFKPNEEGSDERRSFSRNAEGSERELFRKPRSDSGERRSFSRDRPDGRRSFAPREGGGERRDFKPREAGERRSFSRNAEGSDGRRSFSRSSESRGGSFGRPRSGERKSFGAREESGSMRSFDRSKRSNGRSPLSRSAGPDGRRSFNRGPRSDERRSFAPREGKSGSDRSAFKPRERSYEKRSFAPKGDGDRKPRSFQPRTRS